MKVHAFLHYRSGNCIREPGFVVYPFDMSSTDIILVGEVDVEAPDFAAPSQEFITGRLVDSLKKEKEKVLAETHIKVKRIDDHIQQLLSITYQPDGGCDA